MKFSSSDRLFLQGITAVGLTVFGLGLLVFGILTPPIGEIHNSVLIAYGEVSTFAGALFGVDYSYRVKYSKDDEDKPKQNNKNAKHNK